PCLLPVPPPPTSQLFPYTTLFRSGFPASSLRRMLNRPRIRRFLHRSLRLRTVRCGVAAIHAANSWHAEFSAAFRSNREPFFVRLDRKSTRLNSSHVKISYAVFCLK